MPHHATTAEQETFVLTWLAEHYSADACNQDFHDEFWRRFGGARVPKYWGAQPVLKTQRLLERMWRDGLLERARVGLWRPEPGLPRWVYVYTLPHR